jgi:hypothetical protein
MPMYAVGCEARLAIGDASGARGEAERLRGLGEQTAERAWRARARQLCARVALAEGSRTRAEREIAHALELIEGAAAPLAAWRVYETAAEVYEQRRPHRRARHYRELRNATLLGLAESLAKGTELRQSIQSTVAAATT